MIVSKFGGTSVGSFEAMKNCSEIIAANPKRSLVVISATSGTTNDLVALASSDLDSTAREGIIIRIKERHLSICEKLKKPVKAKTAFKEELTQFRRSLLWN